VLVRSWNLFHGNTTPPQRHAFLDEMLRLATADRPDVLCVQEVPAWALGRLGAWTGMRELPALAARPVLGPMPIPSALGRALTAPNHGLFRSAFAGQGNAILLTPALRVVATHTLVLNPRRFRDAQARWLGLDWVARLAWAKERRVCHAARVETRGGRALLVANMHCTSYPPDQRLPDAELLRAASFADAVAEPTDVVVLAGDFNTSYLRSRTLHDLCSPEWGFSPAGPAIDHILVRGAEASPVHRWPDARRERVLGELLSDHSPVEVEVELA
jgi:endonuclease/exonuclease/phosphatase family metal-dependent hydrolase